MASSELWSIRKPKLEEAFLAVVEAWKGECPDYHPVRLREHEGWEYFDACIRPDEATWRWLADQRTVEQLVEAGSDPHREHALEFVFLGSGVLAYLVYVAYEVALPISLYYSSVT